MKDLLILLALLIAQSHKVCPLPNQPDSDGNCSDPKTYLVSNLCCSKCQPGHRLVKDCTETTDTVCEPCGPDMYLENWNYASNCFSCTKCKRNKGLEYANNCSATSRSRCVCMPGWYCSVSYDKPYCEGCEKRKVCKAGSGAVVNGTETSNTKCKACADGTFSDQPSYTEPCRPHTDCGGRAVVRRGNATADTVCEALITSTQLQSSTKEPRADTALPTASTVTAAHPITSVQAATVSRKSVSPSVTLPVFNTSTKIPPTDAPPGFQKVATICGVVAVLFLITIIVLCLCKSVCKKDTQRLHHKVDANGNSESCNKQGYMDETKLMSFTVTSPEQQCLLEKGEASSNYSQYSTNTESLPRTVGSSSHESIGPLQSTVALNDNQSSALSEPKPLISNTNTAESSILTPSSPQTTSPQIINPVTTSPHVNVNITFHIGNGTCGTQPVMSTDFKQADCKVPFGEEEETFSIPQQEDGKRSFMSVEESTTYCAELPA